MRLKNTAKALTENQELSRTTKPLAQEAETTRPELDFSSKAWKKARFRNRYTPCKNGLNRPYDICMKIPTVRKTLLASKTIDLVNISISGAKWACAMDRADHTDYKQTISTWKTGSSIQAASWPCQAAEHTNPWKDGSLSTQISGKPGCANAHASLWIERQRKTSVLKDSGGFRIFPPEDDKKQDAMLTIFPIGQYGRSAFGKQIKLPLAILLERSRHWSSLTKP